MNRPGTSSSTVQPEGIPLSLLWGIVRPWRGSLLLVGVSVPLGALELAPPLLVKSIIDEHLTQGRP